MKASTPSRRSRIVIESLEPVRPGSAAEIHLSAITTAFDLAERWIAVKTWQEKLRLKTRVLALIEGQLSALAAAARADIVYSRWHVLGGLQYLGYRLLRKPYILELNGTYEDIVLAHRALAPAKPLLKLLAMNQIRGATGIVTVTEGLASWAKSLTKREIPTLTLPNGAPDSLSEKRSEPASPPYVAFIGQFAAWQGIETLIDATRHKQWPENTALVVAGSGALEPMVRSAHQDGALDYRGRLPREQAYELLSRATASISPQSSRFARNRMGVSPIKVAESLMLGVPPVVSDLPGQESLIRRAPAGEVFRADDAEALATAVKRAIDTPAADRDRLAEYALTHVSWKRIGERVAAWCERLTDTEQASQDDGAVA